MIFCHIPDYWLGWLRVIATVINQMGAMGGSGIGGAILFIVVFLVGHSINIGINLLGAYVHTNRLSFVEFFGKFYEGGGSEFTPLGVNTKYYKLKGGNKSWMILECYLRY